MRTQTCGVVGDILWSLDAQLVVNLSPGSGRVGRACLRSGVHYVALCRAEGHAAWIGNVLDREACELIVTNSTPLFEQDLATMLKQHVQEVFEQLDEQRNTDSHKDGDDEEGN